MDRLTDKTNIRSVESRRGKLLWGKTPHRDAAEFTDLRYTACECPSAIEFDKWGYTVRCGENGRVIKCFIVITMYAEDDGELDGTTRGVCENLKNFPEYADISVSWQEIAVCVVSDGRLKANSACLEYASSMGYFDQELMQKYGNPGHKDWRATWDTYMHMFEFSMQMKEDASFEKCYPPLQILFGLKERNGGKLDSHLWFFNAFANHLNPKYCFLLDVGTIARSRSICKLYQAFERNSQVAGVCGEIAVFKPDYLNPVEASQHFEYKMSHILDKATESIFGYISVLPGAFSAYRYEAIRPGEDGSGPLLDYFKSITATLRDLGPFKANMYLAEDRILCYEIIARNDCNWILEYVKNSVAETDVPNTLHDLVKQRRRWLNGSFFAMLYAVLNFNRLWTRSSHSLGRKLLITLQFVTYVINIVLTWFLIGTFYLGFMMVISQALQATIGKSNREGVLEGQECDYRGAEGVIFMISYLYLFLTLTQLIMALGNKPENMPQVYSFCALFYGVFTLFTMAVVSFLLADSDNAAWQCNDVPAIVSCNQKDKCIAGFLYGQLASTGEDGCTIKAQVSGAAVSAPGMICNKDADARQWDCVCNEDQVGRNRFADCQTICSAAPIPPTYLRWFTIGGVLSYFVGALLHGELKAIVFTIIQYYYMLPTFINIFAIYSYCNVHDISWGTKGIEAAHGPDTGSKVVKKKAVDDDADRPRGETAQREADAKQTVIAQKRELSKAKALAKEMGHINAMFQAFRSYLVIIWLASNAMYIGLMEGFINIAPDDTAPAHFFICTEQMSQQRALIMGFGQKGGAWAPASDGDQFKNSALLNTPSLSNPSCLAYGKESMMEEGYHLITPVTLATLKSAADSSGCTKVEELPQCCSPIDKIMSEIPPVLAPATVYLIMLFGLVVYTLGLKLIGSVLYLVVRTVVKCTVSSSNKKRQQETIRRQEIVTVNSPMDQDAGLSPDAIAAGWSAQVDPATGRTYYQNTTTGQTDWEPPSMASATL
jgi:cellulose synthase/poly-beta-1,6-N-acetylglucosamine synthase-like glycosyltransferase